VLKLLNERHSYDLKLVLLSIDEGITGYRDDSLETVKRNQQQYDLPLIILTYKELYGWMKLLKQLVERIIVNKNISQRIASFIFFRYILWCVSSASSRSWCNEISSQ
jgi:tRNA(Ile)-lysidine synthase TilS/MesJ